MQPLTKLLAESALVATIVACATTGTAPRTVPTTYVPKFDFSPPAVAAVGATGVTIALVSPQYPEARDALWLQLWPTVPRNLAGDFEELLTARGFTLKGPYAVYDEMVYGDKQGSDLVLKPQFDVQATLLGFTPKEKPQLMGLMAPKYVVETGNVQLTGRVTLVVSESMTDTRLWVKSIDVPQRSIQFSGEIEYDQPPRQVSLQEPGLRTGLGRALEQVYAEILQTAWDYLDPAEMQAKKREADEIKKKAGFAVIR